MFSGQEAFPGRTKSSSLYSSSVLVRNIFCSQNVIGEKKTKTVLTFTGTWRIKANLQKDHKIMVTT